MKYEAAVFGKAGACTGGQTKYLFDKNYHLCVMKSQFFSWSSWFVAAWQGGPKDDGGEKERKAKAAKTEEKKEDKKHEKKDGKKEADPDRKRKAKDGDQED